MSIGQAIRNQRGERTLTDLSSATGVSVSMLSMIERDRRTPSEDTLLALAEALGTTVFDLRFEAEWGVSWTQFGAAIIDANDPKTSAQLFNDPSRVGAIA